ncbi:MFS transporter [Burkholderia vietnamiensis]|uniref:MFS transporter n=1 Tax=Burkholderia vietnamiensis TaxID=60552 RepID=UPI0007575FFA|nr:MFS transporter [Burkholderia vietnamiensis]KVE99155.1 4-hydroxyphenylacetate permease [Burkholderia vietnamiensis]
MKSLEAEGDLQISAAGQDSQQQVLKKVSRRLLGFLFILFCFSYLDRINISFAALSMNRELGLTATAFGLANTAFYVGYVIFEVPSNLMLERFGARRWLARIMVTWGIASTLTLFAVGPNSLYLLRCLVGIAEAGFLPGVLLYMTYWFPRSYRARANSMLMIAMPITSAVGSIASGFILQMHGWLGLAGWQWLFLLEGTPTILLGFLTWKWLDDSPAHVTWLSAREKDTLTMMLAEQPTPVQPLGWREAWREMPTGTVIALSATYFCLVLSLNASATWTPQIIKAIHPSSTMIMIGMLSAIPAALTVVTMLLWSRRSDRRGERRFHTIGPMLLAAIGCLLTGYTADPLLRMIGVIATAAGAFTAMSVFWTSPAAVLDVRTRALGIAVISSSGILGSAVSPLIFGVLRDITKTFASGLAFTAAMLVVGALTFMRTRIDSHTES